MAIVYLIEGPVGAGKSTFSADLSRKINAPHFNLDAWMVRLFRPDRPAAGVIEWYVERKARCIEQIWDVSRRTLEAGCDVILELGLVQHNSRQAMYKRVQEAGYSIVVYVLDAPRDERRERVQLRNVTRGETFAMEVPDEVFEIASDMWEQPDDIECNQQKVIFVTPEAVDEIFDQSLTGIQHRR